MFLSYPRMGVLLMLSFEQQNVLSTSKRALQNQTFIFKA